MFLALNLTGVPFAGLVIGPIFGINLPFSSAFLIVGRTYWRTRPIRHLFFFGGGVLPQKVPPERATKW